jgi:MFS family permease
MTIPSNPADPVAPTTDQDAALDTAATGGPTPTQLFRLEARPPRGFVVYLLLAAFGAGAAQMSAALLTLTLKATAIDSAGATTAISIASGLAGILTLIAFPIVGTMSDRTRSRFGRRRPYLFVAAIAFVVGGILLVTAQNLAVFVIADLFVTLGAVCATVTIIALLTDQLPADRRGSATALLSIGLPIGALLATALSIPFGADLVPLVGLPTALAVVFLVLLALAIRDPKWQHPLAPFSLRKLVGVFWVNPLRFPNFTWIFTSRMLVFSGVAALNGYQAIYMLQKLAIAPAGLGGAITLTVVANAGVTFLVAPFIGRLSDRLGIRKPFIFVAALILAAGLVAAAMATNLWTYLGACLIVGLGQGVYFAVELAFATQLLPDPENPAKDLGILKIADNLPVTIVAAVAPALLAIGATAGPNFAPLFLAGALAAVLGGFTILLVRGQR